MDAARTALSKLDDVSRAEYWAALALRRTKGLGARGIRRLLVHFGSAYEAVYHVSLWKDAGVPSSKGEGLTGDAWREEARPEWEDSRDLDGDILLWTDPRYPALLRELPDAPALLYCRGDLSLLSTPCVAIVGSRASSLESQRLAHEIARELSACGITIVSGMARGIDSAAHTGALAEQGGTIAVFGSGLDVIYPPENKVLYSVLGIKGLLVSEFPPGTRPQGPLFPVRNRIISGLSLGVLVVEAARRSGSLVTARLALEQNRAVYAVPPVGWRPESDEDFAAESPISGLDVTPESSDGCSSLLAQGARPVQRATDILEDLFPQLKSLLDALPPLAEVEPVKPVTPRPVRPAHAAVPAQAAREPDGSRAASMAEDVTRSPHSREPFPPVGCIKAGGGKTLTSAESGESVSPAPLAVSSRPAPPVFPADSPEGRLLTVLREHGPLHPDDLLPLCEEDAGRLSALLVVLEVKGAVLRLPGARYQAV